MLVVLKRVKDDRLEPEEVQEIKEEFLSIHGSDDS